MLSSHKPCGTSASTAFFYSVECNGFFSAASAGSDSIQQEQKQNEMCFRLH